MSPPIPVPQSPYKRIWVVNIDDWEVAHRVRVRFDVSLAHRLRATGAVDTVAQLVARQWP